MGFFSDLFNFEKRRIERQRKELEAEDQRMTDQRALIERTRREAEEAAKSTSKGTA